MPTAHLTFGTELPPIALRATHGRDVCLAARAGRSIVAVYPWTGRPGHPNPPNWDHIPGAHGSTPELEAFRDAADGFASCHTTLFGLSRQDTDYQRELAVRLGLNFEILSDAQGRFADALALPSFATGGERYLKRLTLVIANGHIEKLFYPIAEPACHAGDVPAYLTKGHSPSASSSASSTE